MSEDNERRGTVVRFPDGAVVNPPPRAQRQEGRRKLLKVLGLGGVAVGAGLVGISNIEQIAEFVSGLSRTEEQERYFEQFKNTPPEKRLSGLIVGSEGALVRLAPDSRRDLAYKLGKPAKLDPGTKIESAIVIKGNDPFNPHNSDRKADWLVIPSGKNSVVFAFRGNFIESKK